MQKTPKVHCKYSLKRKANTSSVLSRYLTTDRNKTVYWQIYNFNNNLVFKRLYFFVRYALKVIEFKTKYFDTEYL